MIGLAMGVTASAAPPGIVSAAGRLVRFVRVGTTVHALMPTRGNPPTEVPTIQWRLNGVDIDGETGVSIEVPDASGDLSWTGTDTVGSEVSSEMAVTIVQAVAPTITITQQPTIGALTEGAVPGDVVVTAPTGTVSSGGAATVSGPEYRRGGTGTGATGWDDPAGAGWQSAAADTDDIVRVRYTLTDPAGRAAPVYAYAQTTVQAVPDVATAAPEFTGTVLTALGSTEPVPTPEAPVFTGTVLTQE